MWRGIAAAGLLAAIAGGGAAAQSFGPAGLFSRDNRADLPPITLSAGMPIAEAPLELRSGGYYEIEIIADGSAELALYGPAFFRAIWIDEIVVNDIEIRPMAVDSLEFDDEGTAEISFIAIRPGTYTLGVPGNASQSVEIVIQ